MATCTSDVSIPITRGRRPSWVQRARAATEARAAGALTKYLNGDGTEAGRSNTIQTHQITAVSNGTAAEGFRSSPMQWAAASTRARLLCASMGCDSKAPPAAAPPRAPLQQIDLPLYIGGS
uniref:Uncharacterized protein n=1 Tax=Arundo donax TaxID=35708 RepID=A0A0A9GQT5_ARUDO